MSKSIIIDNYLTGIRMRGISVQKAGHAESNFQCGHQFSRGISGRLHADEHYLHRGLSVPPRLGHTDGGPLLEHITCGRAFRSSFLKPPPTRKNSVTLTEFFGISINSASEFRPTRAGHPAFTPPRFSLSGQATEAGSGGAHPGVRSPVCRRAAASPAAPWTDRRHADPQPQP